MKKITTSKLAFIPSLKKQFSPTASYFAPYSVRMAEIFYHSILEYDNETDVREIIKDEIAYVNEIIVRARIVHNRYKAWMPMLILVLIISILIFGVLLFTNLFNELELTFTVILIIMASIYVCFLWNIIRNRSTQVKELFKYRDELKSLESEKDVKLSESISKKMNDLSIGFKPVLKFDGSITELMVLFERFTILDRNRFYGFILKNIADKNELKYKRQSLQSTDAQIISKDKNIDNAFKSLIESYEKKRQNR